VSFFPNDFILKHPQEALIDTRQQVLLLQEQIQKLKEQNSFSSSQIDVERKEIERRKESLASSEVALDAAQHQLRNAHLEIEVWLDSRHLEL
jgi:hypothetical protein